MLSSFLTLTCHLNYSKNGNKLIYKNRHEKRKEKKRNCECERIKILNDSHTSVSQFTNAIKHMESLFGKGYFLIEIFNSFLFSAECEARNLFTLYSIQGFFFPFLFFM